MALALEYDDALKGEHGGLVVESNSRMMLVDSHSRSGKPERQTPSKRGNDEYWRLTSFLASNIAVESPKEC